MTNSKNQIKNQTAVNGTHKMFLLLHQSTK